MQIDFHHAVTYVTARIAGFPHEDAEIIAYSAQYVDDATCSGPVCFNNGARYHRISSAHVMWDPKNLVDGDNREVWLPFHFLPGNGNLEGDATPEGKFINKLICLPDSPVAKDMVKAAICDRDKPYGLHRLGIVMHVYADTWAHQQFAGVLHEVNEVEKARETGKTGVFKNLDTFLGDLLDDAIPALGHGRANILPDMPFLSWQYKNGRKEPVSRNNTEEFCKAADRMCVAMKQYLAGDPEAKVTGLDEANLAAMKQLFKSIREKDGNKRHKQWLNAISDGTFKAGDTPIAEELVYNDKGRNSWKAEALGSAVELPEYEYNDGFLTSNWKRFHDALQMHRLTVSHEILPKYGICAA